MVTKDFAMDPDENVLKKAAELMVSSLASSLALVTCREPLRVSLTNHLWTLLQNCSAVSKDMTEFALDQVVHVLSTENLELGCNLIEQAVVDKARKDIDEETGRLSLSLVPELCAYELRASLVVCDHSKYRSRDLVAEIMASSPMVVMVLALFMPAAVARRSQMGSASLKREDEEWWWTPFQDDLSPVKDAALTPQRFTGCEHIGVVVEGDANRPDMREEALLWVDFLMDQGYCVAYFFDWARHASHAWSNKDVTMNFGLGWKDALKEVEQSNDGQVVQIMNSTKENWKIFTSSFETICKTEGCALKRVVFAFEDHGEYRLLGLPEHKKLMREDLLGGLRSLYRAGPDVKLLAYVSACKSGSMFGGPQYSAKELLQAHYIDCELRDDGCVAGALSAGGQTVVIAGHSVVGVRQRALLRATEGLMEAQAMCDLATGDGPNSGIFSQLPPEKLHQLAGALRNASAAASPEEAAEARQLLASLEGFLGKWPRADKADSSWQLKVDEAIRKLEVLTHTFEIWKELVVALKKYRGVTTPEALQEIIIHLSALPRTYATALGDVASFFSVAACLCRGAAAPLLLNPNRVSRLARRAGSTHSLAASHVGRRIGGINRVEDNIRAYNINYEALIYNSHGVLRNTRGGLARDAAIWKQKLENTENHPCVTRPADPEDGAKELTSDKMPQFNPHKHRPQPSRRRETQADIKFWEHPVAEHAQPHRRGWIGFKLQKNYQMRGGLRRPEHGARIVDKEGHLPAVAGMRATNFARANRDYRLWQCTKQPLCQRAGYFPAITESARRSTGKGTSAAKSPTAQSLPPRDGCDDGYFTSEVDTGAKRASGCVEVLVKVDALKYDGDENEERIYFKVNDAAAPVKHWISDLSSPRPNSAAPPYQRCIYVTVADYPRRVSAKFYDEPSVNILIATAPPSGALNAALVKDNLQAELFDYECDYSAGYLGLTFAAKYYDGASAHFESEGDNRDEEHEDEKGIEDNESATDQNKRYK
ncbi:unnamed protein product [Prorocentrum cordatum]|uniref:CCR4-NOT transcription complex subunit 1 domain-containing protein n=1 Tax=Prorocentrum cordatum TaxID=2364126 RepID=A0ABN9T7E0_9DINO|nr:unnamed protein product [Polarella glacialis]